VEAQESMPLASLGCSSGTQYVWVPATAQKIRVYFTDTQIKPFVLPRKIELTLAERH
jgi:hypothetical protein